MSGHGEFDSPVDLKSRFFGMHHPLRWTTLTIATASLFLLATNARSLRDWVDEQAPGPLQAQAAELAASWESLTTDAGLGTPRVVLKEGWKTAQAARFGKTGPDPETGPGEPDQR